MRLNPIALFAMAAIAGAAPQSAIAEPKALIAAGYVDVLNGDLVRDAVIIVDAGRIVAAGPASETQIPDNAKQIDLPGKWLIPGLMNVHVHLGLILPGIQMLELAGESEAALALRMADNANKSLLSGVTTIRLTGELKHADLAVAHAIARGQFPGPRIFTAAEIVSISGGHGTTLAPTNAGPYEVRKETRRQIRAGADWIKSPLPAGSARRAAASSRVS